MRKAARLGAATLIALLLGGGAGAAQNQCAELLEARCLQKLGAGADILPDSSCGQQLDRYRGCVSGWAAAGASKRNGAASKSAAFSARLRALPRRQGMKECGACPVLVSIPSGEFTMGSPENEPGRVRDEGPQRKVAVSAFAIGAFEVRFSEWEACVADGGCGGYWPDDNGWGRGDRPVINVTWGHAQSFVDWLNSKIEGGAPYRLPTEAEWEYAARAGAPTPFWWGSGITPDQANYFGETIYKGGGAKGVFRQKTTPVGSFLPNPFGLHQVHGNVAEWVQDCWTKQPSAAPKNGTAKGSENCAEVVVRGGAWSMVPRHLRAANRDRVKREQYTGRIGFRVARSLSD